MVHVDKKIFEDLKIKCDQCFGFCCVALYFSKCEGFPIDKVAGQPCINLQSDFTCSIHKILRDKGLKGCTSYDCFGAGQKVAQESYGDRNWMKEPENSEGMFQVFLVIRQLKEMQWYLTEALVWEETYSLREELKLMITETEKITNFSTKDLINLDLTNHRSKVNKLLRKSSDLITQKYKIMHSRKLKSTKDFMGANLRRTNLIGADFSGALLIAADLRGNNLSGTNFIGADTRDMDIRGANLKESIFLTQYQINAAIGDRETKLPFQLEKPKYWQK